MCSGLGDNDRAGWIHGCVCFVGQCWLLGESRRLFFTLGESLAINKSAVCSLYPYMLLYAFGRSAGSWRGKLVYT